MHQAWPVKKLVAIITPDILVINNCKKVLQEVKYLN